MMRDSARAAVEITVYATGSCHRCTITARLDSSAGIPSKERIRVSEIYTNALDSN